MGLSLFVNRRLEVQFLSPAPQLNLQPRGFEGDVSPSWGVCGGAGPSAGADEAPLCRPGDGWMVQFLSPAPHIPATCSTAALPCQFNECNHLCFFPVKVFWNFRRDIPHDLMGKVKRVTATRGSG